MEARIVSVRDFLRKNDVRYYIPIYQRDYAWGKAQCEQLFNDIKATIENGRQHFIGSIVEFYNSSSSHGVKDSHIIDGQQRLTTTFLLYIALSHLDEFTEAEEYDDYLYISGKPKKGLKLYANEKREKILNDLLHKPSNDINNKFSENYDFFTQRLKQVKDLIKFKNALDNLCVVLISLSDQDNPQEVFESLNSTGLKLQEAELIQNYVLMNKTPDQQEEIYDKYWSEIKSNTGENLSDFMRYYLTTINNKLPNKNKVYETFKDYLPRDTSFEDFIVKLEKIKKFSEFYHRIMHPDDEQDLNLKEEFKYYNKLNQYVSLPFLMLNYNDYADGKLSKKDFVEILKLIQNYSLRRNICDLPTNVYNKLYATLYKKLQENLLENEILDYLSIFKIHLTKKLIKNEKFPTNQEVVSQLKNKYLYNTNYCRYILEKLENHENKEIVSFDDKITIEHVFPQTSDKWQLSKEDRQYMEDHLHCLANLTVTGRNSELSNKPFSEKKKLFQDSRLWLNRFIADQQEWTSETLRDREKILFERFFNVFPYPISGNAITSNTVATADNRNTLFNDFKTPNEIVNFNIDLAGAKIKEAVLFGEPLNVQSSMKSLYIEVCRKIYAKNKDPYGLFAKYSTDGRNDLHKEIADGIWLYTTLSAEKIISLLQKHLNAYNLQNELKIKLKFKQ